VISTGDVEVIPMNIRIVVGASCIRARLVVGIEVGRTESGARGLPVIRVIFSRNTK